MNTIPLVLVLAVVVTTITIFYVPFIMFYIRLSRKKNARQEFFRAVHSILGRVQSDEDAAAQIGIIYKKMPARFSHIPATYRNTADFLEDLLYRINAFGSEQFKSAYNLDFTDEFKTRVVNLLNSMKAREPFTSVSSKYGNMLNLIKQALDSNNTELGVSSLRQLADDIEVLEDTLDLQSKRNQVSFIISVVGVVLTLIFGALSLIPFIKASIK